MTEDAGHDVSDMDGPDADRSALAKIKDAVEPDTTRGATEGSDSPAESQAQKADDKPADQREDTIADSPQ